MSEHKGKDNKGASRDTQGAEDLRKYISEAEAKMQRSISTFQKELNNIRSSRATPSMLDHVQVEYYGANMPLNQLATINAPEARMIVITPFDKSAMSDIEKSILKSDLNLTPQNDGNVIRLILPELSMERRQELAKQVKHRLEEARVAIRNVRRDANEHIKKLSGKGLSEDELKASQGDVQKLTDSMIHKAEELATKKEKEILTV